VGLGPIDAPAEQAIEIAAENLIWRPWSLRTGEPTQIRTFNSAPEAFEQFLRLHNATNDRILKFAQRHGVLGLCEHGLPRHHRRPSDHSKSPGFEIGQCVRCAFKFSSDCAVIEPLESWRGLSASANALLRLMFEKLRPDAERRDDWKCALWLCEQQDVRCRHGKRFRAMWRKVVPDQGFDREWISRLANEWMRCSGIAPQLFAQGKAPTCRVAPYEDSGPNLFGHLAFRLALSLAAQKGYVVCAHCRDPFAPQTNKVSSERRIFCEKCRADKKPQLYAKRDQRARDRRTKAFATGS
jgi:hypothetical protein